MIGSRSALLASVALDWPCDEEEDKMASRVSKLRELLNFTDAVS